MEDNIAEADKKVEEFSNWFNKNGGIKSFDLKRWVEMGIIEQVENVSEISPSGMYLAIHPHHSNTQKLERSYLCQYDEKGFKGITGYSNREYGDNNHRWVAFNSIATKNFSYDSTRGNFTGWKERDFYKINNFKKIKHTFMNWNSNPFIKASPNKVENKISKEKKYIKKPWYEKEINDVFIEYDKLNF